MSVILLKDGLHDLHAGTAGGGQVTGNRIPNVGSASMRISDKRVVAIDIHGYPIGSTVRESIERQMADLV
jgi:hypothetical protein